MQAGQFHQIFLLILYQEYSVRLSSLGAQILEDVNLVLAYLSPIDSENDRVDDYRYNSSSDF